MRFIIEYKSSPINTKIVEEKSNVRVGKKKHVFRNIYYIIKVCIYIDYLYYNIYK